MVGSALQLATAAMADNATTHGATVMMAAACCSPSQRSAATFLFFLFYVFTRQFQDRKKMGEKEKF